MPSSHKPDFLKLVEKYLNGTASEEERNTIESYYAHFTEEPDVTDDLTPEELEALKANLRQGIDARISQGNKIYRPLYRRRYFRVAASFLLFATAAAVVVTKLKHKPATYFAQKHDLLPGGNKATLTLANGSKIDVDSLKNGLFTAQPGAQVTKEGGKLSYDASTGSKSAEISYNTLTTPKGGEYQLVLADGTKVWLNAASSLKFPTAFTGSERVVELTGEAYFDVKHDASQPFKVKTARETVQDIGTQFNINSYADENAVTTTLVEGSIRIFTGKTQKVIEPGQQYLLKNNGLAEVRNDVDTDEITAWKSGMFQFNNADMKTIMRQIGRWYNVDVEYQGEVSNATYHGRISRNSKASDVLKILELSGMNFKIERSKIIVK
ncbi:MAG: FecR domain-containing protein [Bacteroidota bacterium]